MVPDDEPSIDLDALQAQFNMAMAETEELVSSWVQPSSNTQLNASTGKKPKKSFEEMERELQEYLRRPPRLGVGAPIPETIGPTAREEAKIKSKLVGHDKKRRWDDGDNVTKPQGSSYEEDEVETEKKGVARVVEKRARADPFNLPGKKKAKSKDDGEKVKTDANISSSVPPPAPDSAPVINGALTSTIDLSSQTTSTESFSSTPPIPLSINTVPSSPTSTKKKKNKKHKKPEQPNRLEISTAPAASGPLTVIGSNKDGTPTPGVPTTTTQSGDGNVDAGPGREEEEEEEWTGFEESTIDTLEANTRSVDSGIKPDGIHGSTKDGSNPPTGLPLLNLNGPPPSVNSDDASLSSTTSKKKKTRRREKHKLHRRENKQRCMES